MKRYLLFAGSCYYPSGGIEDFIKDFDTKEEAISFTKNYINEQIKTQDRESINHYFEWNWLHIFDSLEKIIMYKEDIL